MLILISFIMLLFLSQRLYCDSVIRKFSQIPDNTDLQLNDSVILSCEVQEVKDSLIVVFRKEKSMYSEGCRVFNKDKYEMICKKINKNGMKFIEFKFKIINLEWSDRGKWECLYAQNRKEVTIEIKVPAKFENFEIEPINPFEYKLVNTGPAFLPIESKSISILKGRGSRTNPYNLRNGMGLKITCLSTCSYPMIEHMWEFSNSSHDPIKIFIHDKKLRNTCSSPNNEGMFSTQSEAIINCSALNMVGANEVVCKTNSNKISVYILCPGGERPWELTIGEIIGLVISVGLIILLFFLLCLMIKRSKSVYRTPLDSNSNTYSSGVKV